MLRLQALSRVRLALLLSLGCVPAILPAADSHANVLPEAAILFHVDPTATASCDLSLTDCHEITRYTDGSGTLVFAAFVYPLAYLDEHLSISSLQGTVTWPDSWNVLDWTPCGAAEGSFVPTGRSGNLTLTWPVPQTMEEDLFLAALFLVQAPDYGEFDIGWTDLVLGAPEPFEVLALGVDAQAGVACSYCATQCARNEYCSPVVDPMTIDIDLAEGEVTETEILVDISAPYVPGDPCPLDCTCSEDWMSMTIEYLEPPLRILHITLDATGLSEGFYEGWVRVEGGCVRCTRIRLTVQPSSGAPDPADPSDPRYEDESWGRIKSEFR